MIVTVMVFTASRVAEFGLRSVMNGPTVNGRVLLVPFVPVRLMVRAERVAPDGTLTVAVTEVAVAVMPVTVIPPPPETVPALTPARFVPVKVTLVAPLSATFGVTLAIAGAITVNGMVLVLPPGVTTDTVLAVAAAVVVMVKVAVTVVSFEAATALAVTPVPEMVSAVAPVRPAPVSVTGKLVPSNPEFGFIEASVGAFTVNDTVLLPGTLTFLLPVAAAAVMVKVAVTVVSFTTVTALAVTPVPEMVTEGVPVKPDPVSVTGKLCPRNPEVGLIELSVRALTVNGTVLLLPAGVPVTVTVLAPVVAVAVMVKVALTVVSFTTVTPLALTPVPEMVTPVAPVRLVPVIVTATVLAGGAELGLIEVSVGASTVNGTGLVAPSGVVMLMVFTPAAVVLAIVILAVTVVSFTTVGALMVMPVAGETVNALAPVKPMPVKVNGRLVTPRRDTFGETEFSVGATTSKVTKLLTPPGVVMVTFLLPRAAVDVIEKVAVTELSLTTFGVVEVMPPPDTWIREAAVRPVPVRVTATLFGVVELRPR
jgi:hypothetical protein